MNKMIVVSHSLQDQTDIQLAIALNARGLDPAERKQVHEEFERRFHGMRWREGYQIKQQVQLQIPAKRKAMRKLTDAELEMRLLVPDVGEVALASAEINRRERKEYQPIWLAKANAAMIASYVGHKTHLELVGWHNEKGCCWERRNRPCCRRSFFRSCSWSPSRRSAIA